MFYFWGSSLQLRQEEEFWESVAEKIIDNPDPMWKTQDGLKPLSELDDKYLVNAYKWMQDKFIDKVGISYGSLVHQKFMEDRLEAEAKKRNIQLDK